MLTQNLAEYWEKLYQAKQDTWDLGKVTPPMLEFMKHRLCPKKGRVLVPGAGRGYDANEWAKHGYDTLAVDFAQSAVDSLTKFADKNPKLSVVKLDIFDLSPKSTDPFDIVYEYGCFPAIHPGRRDEYFEIWQKMVKPDGIIAALFYPLVKETSLKGPPHSTSENELMARIDGVFKVVERITPKTSVKERKDQEQFWILKKL